MMKQVIKNSLMGTGKQYGRWLVMWSRARWGPHLAWVRDTKYWCPQSAQAADWQICMCHRLPIQRLYSYYFNEYQTTSCQQAVGQVDLQTAILGKRGNMICTMRFNLNQNLEGSRRHFWTSTSFTHDRRLTGNNSQAALSKCLAQSPVWTLLLPICYAPCPNICRPECNTATIDRHVDLVWQNTGLLGASKAALLKYQRHVSLNVN